jgi:hypothetical protein
MPNTPGSGIAINDEDIKEQTKKVWVTGTMKRRKARGIRNTRKSTTHHIAVFSSDTLCSITNA